jgi:hypothetical protein
MSRSSEWFSLNEFLKPARQENMIALRLSSFAFLTILLAAFIGQPTDATATNEVHSFVTGNTCPSTKLHRRLNTR